LRLHFEAAWSGPCLTCPDNLPTTGSVDGEKIILRFKNW